MADFLATEDSVDSWLSQHCLHIKESLDGAGKLLVFGEVDMDKVIKAEQDCHGPLQCC